MDKVNLIYADAIEAMRMLKDNSNYIEMTKERLQKHSMDLIA
jgi:hypothetical protein